MSYRIPLIRPYINDRVKELVNEVLDSGFLTEGPVTKSFERSVASYVGVSNAIAFTSCTTGLETALRVAGIGRGDEVIVPDYTYPATAGAVRIVGATPVIVDVDPETLLIDYHQLEEAMSYNTKAVMPVSLFGNPLDFDQLMTLKERYGILIIEDAACALGSSFKGQKTGAWSDMTVFSFHPRKFITTGEGGMVTTPNEQWARALHQYKHFGMGSDDQREGVVFLTTGTNYKMSNILAALGLAQMEIVDDLLNERRVLARNYLQLLDDQEKIKIPLTTENGIHSYQSFAVFVRNRDRIMKQLREQGIEAQIGTYSLHQQPAFQGEGVRLSRQYPGSIRAWEETLVLPMYHSMTEAEQSEVVEKLKACVE
ncbi:DegT/DnrJ/EryC1/StrS aminotransferase family protein [Marinilabilia sp.]|uniref:DegT/DnrJ/EryC1/StrS family aminotransferase n=1 Tax=Marinilabilia sp. TaxID=2021252 RepID=UPI0025BDDA1B|nr:DegT/DnrJ/EryC1/StrS family aminotransferase [Marinilabilia sp.]